MHQNFFATGEGEIRKQAIAKILRSKLLQVCVVVFEVHGLLVGTERKQSRKSALFSRGLQPLGKDPQLPSKISGRPETEKATAHIYIQFWPSIFIAKKFKLGQLQKWATG